MDFKTKKSQVSQELLTWQTQERVFLEQIKAETVLLDKARKLLAKRKEQTEITRTLSEFFLSLQEEKRKFAKDEISKIVTEALQYVYQAPLKFTVTTSYLRGAMQVDFDLRYKKVQGPLTDTFGGGLSDVISMVLRVVCAELLGKEGILVWDEPLKWLDPDRTKRCAEFLKSLSRKLNRQLLIVTHKPELAAAADKTYDVVKRKATTRITICQ